MLTQQFLDEVQARATMSALVQKTVPLKRNGREWKACCPVHSENTPSFYVNDQKGFGFITPEDGSKDLFVHHTSIMGSGFKTLAENQAVEFDVEQKPGKDVTAGTRVARKRRLSLFVLIRALGFEVDRKSIKLKGDAIKTLGKYEAEVAFHREVVRTIPFEVVEE